MADKSGGIPERSPRPRGRPLTAAFVRTVKTPGKFHDNAGCGLYLRVTETGARQWVQRLVVRGGRRELGLGSPPIVTLAEAREAAYANKRLARAGGDPLQSRKRDASVPTFEAAARAVHEAHRPSWRNDKHAAQVIGTLETYAFPKFGARKVSEISSADILMALQPIWLEKPETARRVRGRIGVVLKYAIAKGWRVDNPAETIAQALPRHERLKAHRRALDYSEVAGCIAAVKASGAGLATKWALEFLILTASRSNEVRAALWSEVDLTQATWTIPAERMKMKRAHRVPLCARSLEILREAEILRDETGLIFPSPRSKPLSDMTLSKLVKELGFEADVHGFRTSFRTWAQERTNIPREIAEAALAHVTKDKVERAYARSDVFEKRRELMTAWSAYLAKEAQQ